MKAECSVFGLTFGWAYPMRAVFSQHAVLLPLCVAGHIARAWRESSPRVSGKGAFGVGSAGQLWSKLSAGPAAVQCQPGWMNESTVQALCSSSRIHRIPVCVIQFHFRAFRQSKVGLLKAMMDFLLCKRAQSDLIGPLYLSLNNLESHFSPDDFSFMHLSLELNIKVACPSHCCLSAEPKSNLRASSGCVSS